ncbi:MAG: SpoIID/LytB domain-containing protein [Clostridia bacterium]|nr:SpoIID/LytB domain-containing protein [Clostridia bacterium]
MDIRVLIDNTGEIITIDIEEYLRGVVPSEMPAYFEEEALKAQAIAARTYAAYRAGRGGEYDVVSTTLNQVYDPENAHARTDAAIAATEGAYIQYGGRLIDAVFSATNGGRVRSAQERWGNHVPYLTAKDDPFCTLPLGNSHGVGLCQRGAQQMALSGYSAHDILKFYYEGVEITGKTPRELFCEELERQVGHGVYVWGGNGEDLLDMEDPERWIRHQEADTGGAERSIGFYRQCVVDGITPLRAFDCSGLVYYALKNAFPAQRDMTAEGFYGECEHIKRGELRAGDLVFRIDQRGVYHVGACVSDGVIEAKGRADGVVRAALDAWGESYWNGYGRLKQFSEEETMPTVLKVTSPMMSGAAVSAFQQGLLALGYDIGATGADGRWGNNSQAALDALIARQTESANQGKPSAAVTVAAAGASYSGTLYAD